MQDKKAILVVSFGTSYQETRDKTIGAIEREMAGAWPGYQIRRAFTSAMILNVLAKRDCIHIDNVPEAMEGLVADGIRQLVVQPTHIINGDEYEKMMRQLEPYTGQFERLVIGRPLLTSSEDYQKVIEAVMEEAELEEGDMLVLMGHGTEHHVDAVYAALDYRFQDMGYGNVAVGTVEGYPAFAQVEKQIRKRNPKRVVLMPFMIVAGDHAINDMASQEEDSWKTLVEAMGYPVKCVLKGLGEMPSIRHIYIEHTRLAMEAEAGTK